MRQPTQELLLEILSEEPTSSLSPLSDDACVEVKQRNPLHTHAEDIPSPFKGEGQGKGKDPGNVSGVIIGKVVDINVQGQPLVDFSGNPSLDPVQARSTVNLEKSNIDQDVVLMFDQGDRNKPIIMGILSTSSNRPHGDGKNVETVQIQPTNVDIDGERLTFTAKKEIVLKCGKASITLTKAGKILIRGAYLLSRSSGANRVKGGSVQIN